MVTLSIDTSEQHCSVGLISGTDILGQQSDNIGRGHAEHLLPLVERILTGVQLTYADIGRIGVVTGPGTFTGLRIGLSVARGLALTLGVPCVGISGLHALAAAADARIERDVCGILHAVISGRGGQAFHQAFKRGDAAGLSPLTEASNMDVADIEAIIKKHPGPTVGSGLPLLEASMEGSEFKRHCSAEPVDPIVAAHLANQLDASNHPPEPLYLRAADAKKKAPLIAIAQEADA